jgi:ribonuclease G
MSKELIISVTSQETKAAILENDQVSEIYIERDKEHGVVGSICKGKVTKVLPGMQSAFVDIGLDRDAFLYVSDFFEDTEEYDKIVSTAEDQVAKLQQGIKEPSKSPQESLSPPPETNTPPNVVKYHDRRGRSRRSRRNRLRGKRYDDAPYVPNEARPIAKETAPESPTPVIQELPSILPGESLAKYQGSSVDALPETEVSSDDPETAGPSDHQVVNQEPAILEAAGLSNFAVENRPVQPSLSSDILTAIPDGAENDVPATADETETSRDVQAVPQLTVEYIEPNGIASAGQSLVESETASSDGQTSPVDTDASVPAAISLEAPNPNPAPESVLIPKTESRVAENHVSQAAAGNDKVQFRNFPNTSRFFRRNLDRKRRHNDHEDRGEESPDFPLIGDLLKEGQEILVQISKEPLGTKGARITSHIALPGRYLVYMPTVDHIGVSRKIDSEEERQRLKGIIQQNRGSLTGGFIVRTAGQGRGEEEFRSDIKYLSALWAEIRSKSEKKSAPAVIHRDLSLIQRLLRDQLSSDFSAIRVDNEIEYAGIVEFINRFQPSLVSRVKLYQKETPIFEEFGIQAEIDKALRSKVWLKSGGYIVIDQAEALVAIDVNTGKYVGKSNKLEDTIVKTNVEAAREIARQIRLRDLGGIIVCDFIDMEDRKNRQKVTQTLEEALRSDKSPSKILQFNDFGLVAITRKRVKQSLLKVLCEPCAECSGSGMVKSPQTVCYEIQGEVKKMAKLLDNREITVRVSPEVAKALKTDEASVVSEIESSLKKEVVIKSDPLLHQEHFDIF